MGSFLAELPSFADLGWPGWLTAVVMLAVLAALVAEAAPPDQVLVGGLLVLLVTGVVEPRQALVGFSDPAVLTVAALFVVAAAVRRTGALTVLGRWMIPRSGGTVPALARVMLPASLLSAFLNNTPIVAFLTPLVQQWGRRAGIASSRLLLPLSYATILGGMSTLIGTSTNLVVSSQLEAAGHGGFSMFELAWVGVPATVIGFLYFALGGYRLLPLREDQTGQTREQRREYQFELLVPRDSPLVGETIDQARLRALRGAFLAHIVRRGEVIGPVTPTQKLEAGDVLTFFGQIGVVDPMLQGGELSRVVDLPVQSDVGQHLPFYEAVVSAESSLVGKSLRESDFRERFQAVVLGIHRAGQRLKGSLGRTALEPGDLLLIEARKHFETRWLHSGEFYLVAPLERKDYRPTRRALWVLAILVALMASVAAGALPIVTAAIAAAFLVVLCGGIQPGEARRAVDFSVLLVIASAFGIGQAIHASGLADAIASSLISLTKGLGPPGALAVVYLFTNLVTEILTNNVAAVLVFPIGLSVAQHLGADPRAFAVAIAIAASASFSTPIGYQTNLMVMGPGGYRFGDYVRVGLPLNLLVFGAALVVIPLVWT